MGRPECERCHSKMMESHNAVGNPIWDCGHCGRFQLIRKGTPICISCKTKMKKRMFSKQWYCATKGCNYYGKSQKEINKDF